MAELFSAHNFVGFSAADLAQMTGVLLGGRLGMCVPITPATVRTFFDDHGTPDTLDLWEANNFCHYLNAYYEKFRPTAGPICALHHEQFPYPKLDGRTPLDDHLIKQGKNIQQMSVHDDGWRAHNSKNRMAILELVAAMASQPHIASRLRDADPSVRPHIMVLGAGECNDVPLEEMIRQGYRVTLVDLDEEAMGRAIARLPAALRQFAVREVRDVSGGFLDRFVYHAAEIMRGEGRSSSQRIDDVTALLAETIHPVPSLAGSKSVDIMMSTMLVYPMAYTSLDLVLKAASRVLDRPSEAQLVALNHARREFARSVLEAHNHALADFLRQNPLSALYYASDVLADQPRITPQGATVTARCGNEPPQDLQSALHSLFTDRQGNEIRNLHVFALSSPPRHRMQVREWLWNDRIAVLEPGACDGGIRAHGKCITRQFEPYAEPTCRTVQALTLLP